MKNYAFFDINDISAALSEYKFVNIPGDWKSVGVSTDSRTIEKNNIFVALKGELFDGHDAVLDAVDAGAAAAVVSEQWYINNFTSKVSFDANNKKFEATNNKNNLDKSDKLEYKNIPLVVVPDTLNALKELAFFHRIRFDFPVIAIAGSNGKTSTKELIHSVLSQRYNVLKTYKNYNNQIGVPLMMLCFNEKTDIAVIEIGTNSPGEISLLSEMLKPDFGLITNIGKEHLELLIDLDNVEMEETFLFGYLLKTGGFCFINNDDERLKKYNKLLRKTFTYSATNQDADFVSNIVINKNLTPKIQFQIDRNSEPVMIELNATGYAIALNAVAAAAVGVVFDLTPEEIKTGLENYKQDTSADYARMSLQSFSCCSILNDCYNANPSSMLMALKTLSLYDSAAKKISILGDMFELGDSSQKEHKSVLEYALDVSDEIYLIGKNMTEAAKNFNSHKIIIFDDFDKIASKLKCASEKTIALLKGSRGMQMERLLHLIN